MKRLLPLYVLAFATIIAAVVSAGGAGTANRMEWMPNLVMPLTSGPATEPLGCPRAFTSDCPCLRKPGATATPTALELSPDCPCRNVAASGDTKPCPRCGCPHMGGDRGGAGAGPGAGGQTGPQAGSTTPRCPNCQMKLEGLPLDQIRSANPTRYQNLAAIDKLRAKTIRATRSEKERLARQIKPLIARELRYQQDENRRQVEQMEERLKNAKELNQVREVKWTEIVVNASQEVAGIDPIRQ